MILGIRKIHDASTLFTSQHRLDRLDSALSGSVVSQTELKSIHKQLDKLHPHLRKDDEERWMSLCGRVSSHAVNQRVDAVVEHTLQLQTSTCSAEDFAKVKQEIVDLKHNHGLSLENRTYVGIAEQILSSISGKNFLPTKNRNVVHHRELGTQIEENDMLPKTALLATSSHEQDWESAELAFDLCEIAHCFHQNQFKDARQMLNRLTPEQQARLQEHCNNTDAKTIETDETDDFANFHENKQRFIQALVGMASEIGQKQPIKSYPSFSELEMMFEDVNRIVENDS